MPPPTQLPVNEACVASVPRPYWRETPIEGNEYENHAPTSPLPAGQPPTVVVTFAGLGLPGLGVVFEFRKALAPFAFAHKLYLRDRDLLWYLPRREVR